MAVVAVPVMLIVLLVVLACLAAYRTWRRTRDQQQKYSAGATSRPVGEGPWVLLFGPDGTTESLHLEGERMALGRSSENDFSYPADHTLSRRHLVFERDAEGWSIRDLGSRNGTFVNGLCLGTRHLLRPGDRIAAGHLKMVCSHQSQGKVNERVFFEEAEAAAPKEAAARSGSRS